MEFADLTERALATRANLERHEKQTYGRAWTTDDLLIGLIGDVGDLAKLMQARNGIRTLDNVNDRLEHELADVLWSVLVLAYRCGIDVERAFLRTMDEIDALVASS